MSPASQPWISAAACQTHSPGHNDSGQLQHSSTRYPRQEQAASPNTMLVCWLPIAVPWDETCRAGQIICIMTLVLQHLLASGAHPLGACASCRASSDEYRVSSDQPGDHVGRSVGNQWDCQQIRSLPLDMITVRSPRPGVCRFSPNSLPYSLGLRGRSKSQGSMTTVYI